MRFLYFTVLLLMADSCVYKVDDKKITRIDSLVTSIQTDKNLKVMSIDGLNEDGTISITHKDYFVENPKLLLKTQDIYYGDSIVITSSYFDRNKLIYIEVKYKNQTLQKVYFEDSLVLSSSSRNYNIKSLRETSNYYLKSFNEYYKED